MEKLLKPAEVAAMLGVKQDTLEQWRAARKGPRWIKLGDSPRSPVRYRAEDVQAFLQQNTN